MTASLHAGEFIFIYLIVVIEMTIHVSEMVKSNVQHFSDGLNRVDGKKKIEKLTY